MRRLLHTLVLLIPVAAYAADSVPPPIAGGQLAPAHRAVVTMPIIGAPGQAAVPVKPNIVSISEGSNETVYIALGLPNRIATPFEHPVMIEQGVLAKEQYRTVGHDVYVTPDQSVPIGAFITDKTNPGRVGSLTMIPRAGIPAQTIILVLDGSDPTISPDVAKREMANPPSDYVDGLKQLMRIFVQGGIPNGYQEGPLSMGVARVGSVTVLPERLYNGSPYYVFRYRVENVGRELIELNEASFHEDGVRAVSFWPNARLAPGESTRVYIIADPQGRDQ